MCLSYPVRVHCGDFGIKRGLGLFFRRPTQDRTHVTAGITAQRLRRSEVSDLLAVSALPWEAIRRS